MTVTIAINLNIRNDTHIKSDGNLTMKEIDIICCSNNIEVLNSMLLPGLELQVNVKTNIHIIDPKREGFSSTAESYNSCIEQISAPYVIFVHQDLKLLEKDTLYNMAQYLDACQNDLIGLCGACSKPNKVVYGNVYHGILNENMGQPIAEPAEVETLDEIFLMLKSDVLKQIRFDDKTLSGWHFYVVDFCMQAHQKGMRCVVWPQKSQHKNILEMPRYVYAIGIYPKEFFFYLKKLRDKYKNAYDHIVSPCCYCKTSFFAFAKYYYFSIFKRIVKSFFRKISL